jgi:hypothetical protein
MDVMQAGCIAPLVSLVLAVPAIGQDEPPRSAASYVRAVALGDLNRRLGSLPRSERDRIAQYMEAAERDVLQVTDGCYPDRGVGEHWRNLAERAKGAAVLSSLDGYWSDELRARCRRQAQTWVREIVEEFRRHPNFEYEWQAAFWATEAAIAAWFMWDELAPELREGTADMVAYQADRFVDVPPKMEYRGNTEAETVSWNSSILTLAVNMMPEHPHAGAWDAAAKTYVYNTFAAPQDQTDETPGDDGRPIEDWIVGANIHEDFALENHGQFHIDYIFACFRFHIQGVAMYGLAGRPLPLAFRHHAADVYEQVMLPCLDHDRFVAYVSDNDWRRYHNWTESCVLHAYLGLLEQDSLAYTLEGQALENATAYWRSLPDGFSYENEYVCGKAWTSRIADVVLLHITWPGQRPEALSDRAVESRLQGTSELRSASLLTHYAKDGSLRSYCRGRGDRWVRFVAPRDDGWMLLPLDRNYGAWANGEPLFEGGRVRSARGRDWFSVVRHDSEGTKGEAFVSLPGGYVLFIERISAEHLAGLGIVDNAISVEEPHCRLAMYSDDGQATWQPGDAAWSRDDGAEGRAVSGNWVNAHDRVGLVWAVPEGGSRPEIHLPEPGVRSLLSFRTPVRPGRHHRICIIVCPDEEHRATARTASRVTVSEEGPVTLCRLGRYSVAVNFSATAAEAVLDGAEASKLRPWQVVIRKDGRRVF